MNKLLFLLFSLCLVIAVGCSRGPVCYVVEGVVTFKDAPLSGASVTFVPVDPTKGTHYATGRTDDEGRFTLTAAQFGVAGKGTTAGDYYVTVTRNEDEPSSFEPSGYGPIPVYKSLIPTRYANQTTSNLQAVVEKKKNSFTFVVEEK